MVLDVVLDDEVDVDGSADGAAAAVATWMLPLWPGDRDARALGGPLTAGGEVGGGCPPGITAAAAMAAVATDVTTSPARIGVATASGGTIASVGPV